MPRLGWVGFLLGAATIAAACGGPSEEGLFGLGSVSSSSGSGGSGATSGSGGVGGAVGTGGFGGAGGNGGGTGGTSGAGVGGAAGLDGGMAEAGEGGPGGSAGSGGSGGSGGSPVVPGVGETKCADTVCSHAAMEICCVRNGSTLPFPMPPSATCDSTPSGCSVGITCDGAEDCPGQVCCGVTVQIGFSRSFTRFECTMDCGTQDSVIGCSGPGNCPSGQDCCGTRTQTGSRFVQTECRADCGTDRILCDASTPCPSGTSCQSAQGMPLGYTECR